MPKILVVDDDQPLCGIVEDWLLTQGYDVDIANDGRAAERLLSACKYDVIVLDWGLPDASGVEICQNLRTAGVHTPILILTGKSEIADKEIGLDAGSDDYLTKPFDVKELSARIRSIMRRPSRVNSNVLVKGTLKIDTVTRKLTANGEEIKIFPIDLALLEFFMRHPDEVFAAETLIDRVWSIEVSASSETVRTSIKRVRRHLDAAGLRSTIETVYGVGYKFLSSENSLSSQQPGKPE